MHRDRLIQTMAVEKAQLAQAMQVGTRSVVWRLTTKVHILESKALPIGTRRRAIYNVFWDSLKTITFEGWSSFRLKAKQGMKDALSHGHARILNPAGLKKLNRKRPRRLKVSELGSSPNLLDSLSLDYFPSTIIWTIHCDA